MFVDFDGTLASIVEEPAAARPHRDAVAVLAGLAARWGTVAVVSGRPAAFLSEHLAGAGRTTLLGLYGMERASGGASAVDTHPEAERWRDAVTAAADDAQVAVPAGASVERKGLTVTLHYRAVPERAGEVERIASELGRRHRLRTHQGKMSVELRPPLAVDKGTVLAGLAAGLDAVAFAGDDIGDLPAFAVLGRLRAGGVATLSIASGGPETPHEVVEAADLAVDGPEGVLTVLRRLAEG